jgi:hypothetical protein
MLKQLRKQRASLRFCDRSFLLENEIAQTATNDNMKQNAPPFCPRHFSGRLVFSSAIDRNRRTECFHIVASERGCANCNSSQHAMQPTFTTSLRKIRQTKSAPTCRIDQFCHLVATSAHTKWTTTVSPQSSVSEP